MDEITQGRATDKKKQRLGSNRKERLRATTLKINTIGLHHLCTHFQFGDLQTNPLTCGRVCLIADVLLLFDAGLTVMTRGRTGHEDQRSTAVNPPPPKRKAAG